jgi:DNA-binding transcriptional MerR regulator
MAVYSLPELAEAAGVTPRTVRYYQATGLLQRPARVGRNSVYADEHLDRMRQIAALSGKGLKLHAIRDMVNARSVGKAPIVALLGPEFANEQWLESATQTFNAVELAQTLGERYLGLLRDLEDAGYVRKVETPDGLRWQVDDMPLLRGALQLAEIGSDVALSARARDMLRRRVRRLAEDLIMLWISEAGELYEGEATNEDFMLNIDRIRAVAWQSAAHVMAQEIERAAASADRLGQHSPWTAECATTRPTPPVERRRRQPCDD